MNPRQTQPVPQIVISPSDGKGFSPLKRNKAISRPTRQESSSSSDGLSSSRSRSPSPEAHSLRPRATTGLQSPIAGPSVRPAFFEPNQSRRITQVPVSESVPGWVSQFQGRPEDVKRALTELIDERGHINAQTVAHRVRQIEERNAALEEQKQLDLAKVADGSFGLTKVINPTADDVTVEAATKRYDEREKSRKSFFAEFQQFSADREKLRNR